MYINDFLELLETKTTTCPKKAEKGYKACCPAHDDQNLSLSIAEAGKGTILLHCLAGCSVEEICSALNLKVSNLTCEQSRKPVKPDYTNKDAEGNILLKKNQHETGLNENCKSYPLGRFDKRDMGIKNLKGCKKNISPATKAIKRYLL